MRLCDHTGCLIGATVFTRSGAFCHEHNPQRLAPCVFTCYFCEAEMPEPTVTESVCPGCGVEFHYYDSGDPLPSIASLKAALEKARRDAAAEMKERCAVLAEEMARGAGSANDAEGLPLCGHDDEVFGCEVANAIRALPYPDTNSAAPTTDQSANP